MSGVRMRKRIVMQFFVARDMLHTNEVYKSCFEHKSFSESNIHICSLGLNFRVWNNKCTQPDVKFENNWLYETFHFGIKSDSQHRDAIRNSNISTMSRFVLLEISLVTSITEAVISLYSYCCTGWLFDEYWNKSPEKNWYCETLPV